MFSFTIALLFLSYSGSAQKENSFPIKIPQVDIEERSDGICPSSGITEQARNSTREEIRAILHNTVVPTLDRCPCGGPGPWHRIAHLDIIGDPNQQCPSSWRLITTPVRACGRTTTSARTCDSAIFPSNGFSFSRVCGRISAIQQGNTNAFYPSIGGRSRGLDGAYIGGASLTHGEAGSRQHIWTFAAGLVETGDLENSCPCRDTDWPYQIPSFVENNYFCDSGNPGPGFSSSATYVDNPMWDGEGCGPTSTCCQFNNPPWFCTMLPQPTTDDLEVRICGEDGIGNEDIYIQLVDIYAM